MTDLSIAFGVAIFLFCLFVFILRAGKSGRIILLDWTILGVGFIYGLVGAVFSVVLLFIFSSVGRIRLFR